MKKKTPIQLLQARRNTMIQRCHNPNAHAFDRYGGRGIEVCPRWRESFDNFFADMGMPPKGASLDRIDNDGPYNPENCRWATGKEQNRNTSRNHTVLIDGEKRCIAEWAEISGVGSVVIAKRLRNGIEGRELLRRNAHFLPPITIGNETRLLTEWAQLFDLPQTTIRNRIKKGLTGFDLIKPAHKTNRRNDF